MKKNKLFDDLGKAVQKEMKKRYKKLPRPFMELGNDVHVKMPKIIIEDLTTGEITEHEVSFNHSKD